ncbi:MAG: hypothetical protein OEY49_02425 [Candidatus Heimdallarchaeota archaeon]|nr:hypothetical protein [Candidatus Heimdallarchaeota archaeon]
MVIETENTEQIMNLFKFWDELPMIKKYDIVNFETLRDPIRYAIIDTLATGIQDDLSVEENSQIISFNVRHALSAKEIMNILHEKNITDKNNKQIKKANLYFHLQRLENDGFIKVVEQIPQGKRFTSYYGRTARAFTANEKIGEKYPKDFLVELRSLIIKIDTEGELKATTLENLFNKFEKLDTSVHHHIVEKWISTNEKEIRSINVDMRKLYDFLTFLLFYNEDVFEIYKEFRELLNLR